MLWIDDVEQNLGLIRVGLRITVPHPTDPRFEAVVEDPLGCPLSLAGGRLRDLVDLMIAMRESLDLGGLAVESAPGWSGYWFLLDDDHAVKVSPRTFRRLVDALEAESREMAQARFRLS